MANKNLATTHDVLLFVEAKPGCDSERYVRAGTVVANNGEPVEKQSKGANESPFTFQPVKMGDGKTGFVLANNLVETDAPVTPPEPDTNSIVFDAVKSLASDVKNLAQLVQLVTSEVAKVGQSVNALAAKPNA